ncbi:MAG TPA: polysaccharide deacetylase family protein [Pyrinomonadaceae bacterium]|nr:polysaccharide deacetylase family protein [Pyrinomonadaceae bacterium]
MKKTLLKTIYNLGGFAPFHWAARGKILILMYHRFSREKNPFKISSAEFAAHLEYLSKRSRVLSLSETVERLQNKQPLPPNAAVITIDDGYADAYEIAFPILKKYKMPATLYAVTDFLDGKCWLWTDLMRFVLAKTERENLSIEFDDGEKIEAKLNDYFVRLEIAGRVNAKLKRLPDEFKNAKIKEISENLKVRIPELPPKEFAPISWEQAREMDAENLRIESHTVSHPILTNVSQARLFEELQNSKSRLEDVLERKIEHFCYPNGNLNADVQKAVEKAGYVSAVTTAYGFNSSQENEFTLRRIDAASEIEKFAQSVSGFELFTQKIRNQNVRN